MRYIARITDSGPLSFLDGRDTRRTTTLPYVPGSTLLGGLAAAHALLERDRGEFNEFFFSAVSTFGNLYPATFQEQQLRGQIDPVYPLPLTALSCKHFSGFKLDEGNTPDETPHGVLDSLIPWALFALSDSRHPVVLDGTRHCPRCGSALDRIGGFYRRSRFDHSAVGRAEVVTGLRTRTGINRATGTVQPQVLYSREVLQPGMNFWGRITVPDEYADSFYQFVEEINTYGLLRLGNNRTRGFGRVTLVLEEEETPQTIGDLLARIEQFNAALQTQAKDKGIETRQPLYLPLTLVSDAIFKDYLLRYQPVLTAEYLADRLGVNNIELVCYQNDIRRVMGWNDLWRLPKPDSQAVVMGSVFLFGLSQPLDDDLVAALLALQAGGVGHRRREGYGQVLVASQFHQEVQGQ